MDGGSNEGADAVEVGEEISLFQIGRRSALSWLQGHDGVRPPETTNKLLYKVGYGANVRP